MIHKKRGGGRERGEAIEHERDVARENKREGDRARRQERESYPKRDTERERLEEGARKRAREKVRARTSKRERGMRICVYVRVCVQRTCIKHIQESLAPSCGLLSSEAAGSATIEVEGTIPIF